MSWYQSCPDPSFFSLSHVLLFPLYNNVKLSPNNHRNPTHHHQQHQTCHVPNWRSPTNGNYSRSPAINNTRPVMYPPQTRYTRPPARPYLGHCQICGTQGHTAKRCPSFNLVPVQSSNNANSPLGMNSTWQPQAHYTSHSPSANTSWVLDSGASHHVTADLNNLSLHTPYVGNDDVMLGDGSNLQISHTGSVSLPTPTVSFHLKDVLCVPQMHKNLISILLFCITNNVSIELFPTCFHVKDLQTGKILLRGGTKDGVYVWPAAQSLPPILAFSTVKTTSLI